MVEKEVLSGISSKNKENWLPTAASFFYSLIKNNPTTDVTIAPIQLIDKACFNSTPGTPKTAKKKKNITTINPNMPKKV